MKRVILLAVAIIAAGPRTSAAQSSTDTSAIVAIRGRFQEITAKSPRLETRTFDWDSLRLDRESTDGGSVNAYYENHTLRRAEVRFDGEHGSAVWDIYYWNGTPEFIYVKEYSSGEQLYGPQHLVRERRLYFRGKQPIRYVIGRTMERVSTRSSMQYTRDARELAMKVQKAVSPS